MYVKHELALRTRPVSAWQDLFETNDETAMGWPEKCTNFSMWFEDAQCSPSAKSGHKGCLSQETISEDLKIARRLRSIRTATSNLVTNTLHAWHVLLANILLTDCAKTREN